MRKANSNNVSQVRAVLDPMSAMLRRHRVAGLYVGHPRKGAGDEIALYHTLGQCRVCGLGPCLFLCDAGPKSHPTAETGGCC